MDGLSKSYFGKSNSRTLDLTNMTNSVLLVVNGEVSGSFGNLRIYLAPPRSLDFYVKKAQNLKYVKHGDIIIPGQRSTEVSH